MPLSWTRHGPTAVVTMQNGDNRHDGPFVGALLAAFAEILADDGTRSVVITSDDPKSWSQGVDVEWIQAQLSRNDQQAVKDFLFALNELFIVALTFPMPVIAAINGHVVGNGLILACACDFRFMRADRGYAVIPGVDLGLLFLPGMLALVKKAIPRPLLEEMKLTGGRYDAESLASHYVIREAVHGREETLQRALTFAGGFDKNRAVFGETKRRLNADVIAVMNEEDPRSINDLDVMRGW